MQQHDHIIYGGNAVFASDDTATEETADEKKEDAADDTEKPDVDLSDKKLAFCIYQFSDNFMTLFRTELENYLIELGFSKITSQSRMVRMTRLHSPTRLTLSLLMV